MPFGLWYGSDSFLQNPMPQFGVNPIAAHVAFGPNSTCHASGLGFWQHVQRLKHKDLGTLEKLDEQGMAVMMKSGKTALLVVEEFSTFRLIGGAIRSLGFDARWARSWEKAMVQLQTEDHDIVLLDENQWEGNVRSAVEWLRSHGRGGQIIVMSDMPCMTSWVDYLNAGVVDLIGKSASLAEVKHALELAVEVGAPLQNQ